MSDHTLWKGITPMPDPHQREVQMGYVDGYCLALEDVLEELARLQRIQMEHVTMGDPRWAVIVATTYRPLRKFVNQTLVQARQTLRALKEVK
jgi:hypothetical protein